MRIFNGVKTKSSKGKKRSIQEWLGKLINPDTTGGSKTFKPSKLKSHIHSIKGLTARAKGHQEDISASTGNPIMTKDGHVHEYSGAILAGSKQAHRIEGVTGSASGQDRDHTHKLSGRTSKDGNHSHKYNIETSNVLQKQEKSKRRGWRKEKAALSPCETLPV